MSTKECVQCLETKDINDFSKKTLLASGLHSRYSRCKECMKQYIPMEKYKGESFIKPSGEQLKMIYADDLFDYDESIVVSLLASSKSGKTTLLYNILSKISKNYDIIIFFSANSKAKIYKNFVDDFKNMIMVQDFDPRIIHALHHINSECGNQFRYFILMDDIINVKYAPVVAELFSTYRNTNFSTLHSVQYAKYMNPNARAQCHLILLGRHNNMNQIEKTVNEYLYGNDKLMKLIPEKYKSKQEKLDWLKLYFQANTDNKNFIAYDVLNNKIYKTKSKVLIS